MKLKKYVHNPTVVEVVQWLGNNPFWRGQIKRIDPKLIYTAESNRRLIVCANCEEKDKHKSFVLEHGDWLVNIRGEWCRVEKSLFEEIYQEVSCED
jgi:hypothetical protein